MKQATRRSAAGVVAGISTVLVGLGCTTSTEEFCGRLKDYYTLDALARAIETEDQAGIESGLEDLRKLEEAAPPEIHDDVRQLNDTMIDVVRTVTGAKGPEGQSTPVDPGALREALAAVGDPAQHVTDFADKECGLTL